MLINETPPEMFAADNMKDIHDNYKKLQGNLVFLKDEGVAYAVGDKDKKGCGHIIELFVTKGQWDKMVVKANKKYGEP